MRRARGWDGLVIGQAPLERTQGTSASPTPPANLVRLAPTTSLLLRAITVADRRPLVVSPQTDITTIMGVEPGAPVAPAGGRPPAASPALGARRPASVRR